MVFPTSSITADRTGGVAASATGERAADSAQLIAKPFRNVLPHVFHAIPQTTNDGLAGINQPILRALEHVKHQLADTLDLFHYDLHAISDRTRGVIPHGRELVHQPLAEINDQANGAGNKLLEGANNLRDELASSSD